MNKNPLLLIHETVIGNFLDYSTHIKKIQAHFPILDLLKSEEFDIFENKDFAIDIINSCVDSSNNCRKKLKIDLLFGVGFNNSFNGSAIIKNDIAAIVLNRGLIDQLYSLISTSLDLFFIENIAQMTLREEDKIKLNALLINCCVSYLYYHELAHVVQILKIYGDDYFNFQEKYSQNKSYDIKKHIYEIDADMFGSIFSAHQIINYVLEQDYKINPMVLYNTITVVLFTITNILIQFSENQFDEIYLKQNSHPHPFIRIVKISEQILGNISTNIKIQEPLFEAALQRAANMVGQVAYSKGRSLNYAEFYNENSTEIGNYINDIEKENSNYKGLIRYKSQDFYNNFIF